LHPGFGHNARERDAQNNLITNNQGLNGGIAKLYNDGKLSFLANVGSLIEPTTRTDYNNRINLPLGLFSHSDLQQHWMTAAPHTRSQITGWGGRMASLFASSNQNTQVSMNISIDGTNIFQTGGAVIPYTISEGGATVVTGFNTSPSAGLQDKIFTKYATSLLDQTYSDLLAKSFAQAHRGAIDAAIDFNTQVNGVVLNTPFDTGDSLSRRMKKIAQVIAAHTALKQNRQVFFVALNGFDNHTDLLPAHNNLLPQMSRALSSFYNAMVELGCENDVVTFTASDFARTLGTNGQGSDHAWGGNHMVMGGAVDGGKIFGDFPLSLSAPVDPVNGNLDLGRGRLIPTMSVDVIAAELAMWFGVSNATDLSMILPNINRFYSYSGGQAPVGFLL
jgi:uncharacterized protein (DUF1501 family)